MPHDAVATNPALNVYRKLEGHRPKSQSTIERDAGRGKDVELYKTLIKTREGRKEEARKTGYGSESNS